jgi:predicted MFS family arabinose efflux permease
MTWRFIIRSTGVLVFTLVFNTLLTLTVGNRLHEQMTLARAVSVVQLAQRDLHKLAREVNRYTGRSEPLEHGLHQLQRQFHEEFATPVAGSKASAANAVAVSLALADGFIRYSTDEALLGTHVPAGKLLQTAEPPASQDLLGALHYARGASSYAITVPLGEDGQSGLATAVISIANGLIQGDRAVRLQSGVKTAILGFALGAAILILLCLGRSPADRPKRASAGDGAGWLIVAVLASAQTVALLLNLVNLKSDYVALLSDSAERIALRFKQEIEPALRAGITLDAPAIDPLLQEYRRAFADFTISLIGNGKETSVTALAPEQPSADRRARFLALLGVSLTPDVTSAGQLKGLETIAGTVTVKPFPEAAERRLLAVFMDSITITLISLLVCLEMAIALVTPRGANPSSAPGPAPENYKLMRPAIFLFLFGIDISMAFLPLHMEKLYEPLFSLSKETVMGLPISVEFFCVGLAILTSGAWLDRRGWQEPFLCGALLAAAGGLYSWLAANALHFVIARAIVGFGYGLTLLAAQGFVIFFTTARTKAQGLAHLFAGLYAGSICGTATGAILAESFGYETVLLAGALILFMVIAYTVWLIRSNPESNSLAPRQVCSRQTGSATIPRFLLDRHMFAVICFSSLPAAIAAVGFLNYFSSVYLSRLGVSESTIGQILMLFGICLILLGPPIGRYVDASESKQILIFLGSVLGSLAFLSFHVLEGIAAAVVAVILLGLSNSLVLSSQSAYVLQLEVTRQLGEGKAMGIFRSTSRIGQMLGPLLFAWLIVAIDLQDGVTYFGLAYLLTALLFLLLTRGQSSIIVKQDGIT